MADKYVVQNIKWSGVYLSKTLSNDIIQKVLKLVPLTATAPEIYVATMNYALSKSYDNFKESINHINILKLKSSPWENVTDYCD